MNRNLLKFLYLSLAGMMLFSCVSKKKYYYLNHSGKSKLTDSVFTNIRTLHDSDHQLDVNDVINVTFDPVQYKLPEEQNKTTSVTSNYVIDKDGKINLPNLGFVSIRGYTTKQVADSLNAKYSAIYNSPNVTVTLISYSLFILGEVKLPGEQKVNYQSINILQALNLVGDIADDGNRTNVKVLRKNAAGGTDIHIIDLTSTEMFTSEVFYLKSNDIIIVNQYAYKRGGNILKNYTGITGIMTVLISLTNFIYNLAK